MRRGTFGVKKEQGLEVLVVDDEPDMRAFAAHALTRSGCKVESVPNAAAALELLLHGGRLLREKKRHVDFPNRTPSGCIPGVRVSREVMPGCGCPAR